MLSRVSTFRFCRFQLEKHNAILSRVTMKSVHLEGHNCLGLFCWVVVWREPTAGAAADPAAPAQLSNPLAGTSHTPTGHTISASASVLPAHTPTGQSAVRVNLDDGLGTQSPLTCQRECTRAVAGGHGTQSCSGRSTQPQQDITTSFCSC